jgi:hypothetical protein
VRYAPGKEPPLTRERNAKWEDGDWPLIFIQDYSNLPKIHKGMQSRGFKGSLTNPVQERTVSSFHRTLRRFMQDPHADDNIWPGIKPAKKASATPKKAVASKKAVSKKKAAPKKAGRAR